MSTNPTHHAGDGAPASHDEHGGHAGPAPSASHARATPAGHGPLGTGAANDNHAAAHGAHAHGIAHVMPRKVLLGVWAALMVLTVLTVSAHGFDFGPRLNLLVAMAIATVKASLVVLFFMHLLYDRRFHLLFFLGSLLFVFLFVSLTMLDSGQYERDVEARQTVLQQTR